MRGEPLPQVNSAKQGHCGEQENSFGIDGRGVYTGVS